MPSVKVVPSPWQRRLENLESLLGLIRPVPAAWVSEEAKADVRRPRGIQPAACKSWSELCTTWATALSWRQELQDVLAVMLAVAISTEQTGDQLFLMVIGEPGCLHPDTEIIDPVDGSKLTVSERHRLGRSFHVWSLLEDGKTVGVRKAEAPRIFTKEPMYRVTFRSGREITTTARHKMWDGQKYVTVEEIACVLLRGDAAYPLPSISDTDLSARMRGVRRSSQTAASSLGDCPWCSCSCGGRPLQKSGSVQDALPSQGGAHEHAHLRHEDGQDGRCRCTLCSQCAHLASKDCRPLLSVADERQFQPIGRSKQSCLSCVPTAGHILSSYAQPGTSERSALRSSLPISEDGGQSSHASEDTCAPPCETRRPEMRFFSPSCRPDIPGRQLSLVHPSDASSVPACGCQLRPDGDTASGRGCRSSSAGILLPTCVLTCTGLRPAVDGHSTNVLSQPSCSSMDTSGTYLDSPCILRKFDAVVKVEPAGVERYYDFAVPETENYWACGVINHNSAKSRLCDALLVSKGCLCVEHITGFHSGYTDASGEDFSFLARADRRTWITGEGDVMMANPKFTEIMSQMRRIFDGSSKATYKNKKVDPEYSGLRTPWIMAGTPALLNSDQSRLGDRFLKVLILPPDEEQKRRIIRLVGHAAWNAVAATSNGDGSTVGPALTAAYAMTGGYVDHLRTYVTDLLRLTMTGAEVEAVVDRCGQLAELTADLRARPDPPRRDGQEKETLSTKELPSRLTHQFVRLARCLAAVTGKATVDAEVMRVVGKVALDTSAGRSLNVVKVLHLLPRDQGASTELIGMRVGEGIAKVGTFLRFLQRIKVVELFHHGPGKGKPRWRLTQTVHELYATVGR